MSTFRLSRGGAASQWGSGKEPHLPEPAHSLDWIPPMRNEWPEIPAETPYLASSRKSVVCGDWMVGAPGLEPGTR